LIIVFSVRCPRFFSVTLRHDDFLL